MTPETRANLKVRFMTAAVLVVALVTVLFFLPPVATAVMLTVAILFGAWEWSAFFRRAAERKISRILYVALTAIFLKILWEYTNVRPGVANFSNLQLVSLCAVVWWTMALLWILLAPRRATPLLAAIAGLLVLGFAWISLMHLRFDSARGAEWVLFVLVLVWMADIGGYAFGHKFGRVKLAPYVSPGKTWEGALGGVLLAALVGLAGSAWFDVPTAPFLLLCLAAAAFSIIGDLMESLLKRYAGVKDSGRLFPGHGGMMDRIDSVTGAAPVLLFGLTVLKVLT
jgi:phosphatidate cytidylyltransferase